MPWQFVPAHRLNIYAEEWDSLQQASYATPFLESAFIGPLLEVFGHGDERLALYRQGDRLLAATLLRPLGSGRWETFQPSQLPLGPWICAALPVPGDLLLALLRALPGLSLSVGLTQLDPRLTPRGDAGSAWSTMDYIQTSWVDIEGEFDRYWDARGKNLRQNTRKQRSKLKADGVTTQLEWVTAASDVASAIDDYGALESTGWKAGAGTAMHPGNDQGLFYRRMLERFCAAGRGRLYRYRFNDKVVAMDLCIDSGPLVVILKTAYDERYAQVSPATLMRQDEFREWWSEGRYRRIEFYGRTLDWHTRWTSSERTLYHATAYRWAWLAWLATRRSTQTTGAPSRTGSDT